jgi:hypothetical protein
MKFLVNINQNLITENVNLPSQPLDEIAMLESNIDSNINITTKIPNDVLNSFNIKPNLNPNIWDNFELNPEVKSKIIQIVEEFLLDLEIPQNIVVKDILLTGSLTNFNWSKFSDLDVHIVLDYNQFDVKPKILDKYFYANKVIWNDEHDIKMFDFPIELYVQDVNHQMESKGVYSVLKDKWIQKPTKEDFNIDKNKIKTKANNFIYKLKDIKQDFDDKKYDAVINKTKKLKAKIKQMRNAGLERGGEFSLENIIFKTLRRINFMDVINSLKNKAYDKSMSINEDPQKNWQAVVLIKGEKLKNRKHRLYITTTNKIITSDIGKVAVLGNEIYRVVNKNNQIIAQPIMWKNHGAMLSSLNLQKNSVVISQEKTPFNWVTLPLANIQSALNAIAPLIIGLEDLDLE